MKKLLFVFCILLSLHSFGQKKNLIPDPSIEKYTNCPIYSAFPYTMIDSLNYWYSPFGSPDYYNSCLNGNLNIYGLITHGVPKNEAGYQKAKNGNAYLGLMCYDDNLYSAREYVSTSFTEKLLKGKTYQFSFFVSLANEAMYVVSYKDIGAYFSVDNPSTISGIEKFSITPQCVTEIGPTEFVEDTSKWIEFTCNYKAKGGEGFVTIGNFNDDSNTSFRKSDILYPIFFKGAYYYLDNVSLYKLKPKDVGIELSSILGVCQDSIAVEITNTGDSTLDFTVDSLVIDLQLKEDSTVVQSLQKTINSNQYNSNAPQPLAAESSFMIYFSSLKYLNSNINYSISAKVQMEEDADSSNNFTDTTFTPEFSIGKVNISQNEICAGDSVVLLSQYANGLKEWQFSPNQKDWQNIDTKDTLIHFPQRSGFYRLSICDFKSDTLAVEIKLAPATVKDFQFEFCNPREQRLEIEAPSSIDKIHWYKTAKGGTAIYTGLSYQTRIEQADTFYLEGEKDGCFSEERGIVEISIGGCELEIPNVFTPNGDGINDIFEYRQAYGRAIKTKIYDRWGNKLATFEGSVGWDGKGAAAGTYYYVITADEKVYRGRVMLLK